MDTGAQTNRGMINERYSYVYVEEIVLIARRTRRITEKYRFSGPSGSDADEASIISKKTLLVSLLSFFSSSSYIYYYYYHY